MEERVEEDELEFRKGGGTREAILCLRLILEKRLKKGLDTYIAYVDLEKAFDNVEWTRLFRMLKSPNESKIPVFHSNPLRSRISKPLSTLSSRVRAHLDASKSRASASSVLLGILTATSGNIKNVSVEKSITVLPFSSNVRHSSSHDDLKTSVPVNRPTNLFAAGHFFPPIADESLDQAITGVENIGRRVRLNSGKEGVLRFVGKTQFGEGIWCGVELDHEEGTTDGTVSDVRYFSCAENRGVFALATNVRLVCEEVREYVSDVSDSGPHSLLGITGDIDHVHNDDKPSTSDAGLCRKDNPLRCTGSHQQQQPSSQTPTPNSSTGSFIASCEWKCNSQHSSSPGSLALSHRGLSSAADTTSIQMSKHSSFEYDESLGILTPDQMGELTTCSGDVTVLGGGSCDDFRSLSFHEGNSDVCKNDLFDVTEPQKKYPSMDNILEVPIPTEEGDFSNGSPADCGNNELLDRLFSETDTYMMSASSISDHAEQKSKKNVAASPSLEELPVDELDLSTTLIAKEESNEITEMPISAPPTSFVTSVTSIGSWDNGYQGDGECSRPTSRGADASPLARVPQIVAKVLDPMTDSDFYTESDADLYEDVACLRGDRKARVIDGKLFGSPVTTKMITSQSYGTQIFSSELRGVSQERGMAEEMDSSGIYSDLEKRLDGSDKVSARTHTAMQEESQSDTSGKSSSKSVSSQKFVANDVKPEKKKETVTEHKAETKNTSAKAKATFKQENTLKRRNETPVKSKESMKSNESPVVNKPKMARRNVTAKVKTTTVVSAKCCADENQENHQPPITKGGCKKGSGRWDAVTSKIEKGRSDGKIRSEKLKDVKSKVMCGMPRVAPSKLHKDVKPFSPNGNAINKVNLPNKILAGTLSNSTRSLKEGSSHRLKSRKIRTRMNLDSAVQSVSVSCTKSLSQGSSRNSSITDISDSHADISQHSLPAVQISVDYSRSKKSSSLLCSPVSDGGISAIPLHAAVVNAKDAKTSTLPRTKTIIKQQIGSVNSLVEDSAAMKVPRKLTYRRALTKVVPFKDQNRALHANGAVCSAPKATPLKALADQRPVDPCKAVKIKTKQLNPISKINPLLAQLKYATDGMEAFIILFQRLTKDSDIFVLPFIKQELSKYKKDWLDMKLKLEEANASCRRLKEEIQVQKLVYDQKVEELRNVHTTQVDQLNTCHKQELGKYSAKYEEQLNDLRNKLRNQERVWELKFEDDLRVIKKQAEQKLEEILEETKNQVELLKMENDVWKQKLVKESWKKLQNVEKQFKIKMELVEANYVNQLDETDKEARKREELFLTTMKRKAAGCDDTVAESNLEIGKSNSEFQFSQNTKVDCQNLEEEICSLRTVLDLKHSEIQDLRKQNEKLRKEVQDLPYVSQKLDSAQARVEDLSAQLQTKIENEKKLLKENRRLLETVQHESEKKKRLTFQNEELLWKLKKSTQVAKTLAVFNSSRGKEERVSESEAMCFHSTPMNENPYSHFNYPKGTAGKYLKRSRTEHDIKLVESPTDGDVSPKVLGVVEKSDSVSWVLEIDESPIAVASRMLRRANSLRGVPSTKKKSVHSLQSLTLPSRNKKSPAGISRSAAASVKSSFDGSEANATFANADDAKGELNETDNGEVKKDDDDDNAIPDIASFFDFLHDSDFETDTIADEESTAVTYYGNGDEKRPMSPFSNTTSSDSSLDLDGYDGNIKSYRRFWTQPNGGDEDGVPKRNVTDSSSMSDSEDDRGSIGKCFSSKPSDVGQTGSTSQ